MSTYIDDKSVIRTLNTLSKNLNSREYKNATLRAARKGGNILKKELRSDIPDSTRYEHVGYLKRHLRVVNARTFKKYIGVNVMFKGNDIQVGQGKTRRFWKLADYAYLVLFGNYRSPKRSKGKSNAKGRGNVKGIVNNNIFRSVESQNGNKAKKTFIDNLLPQLRKQISKSYRR